MNWKRSLVACLVATLFASVVYRNYAASPWERLVPFKRMEADPNNSYPLTKDHGPWLIMATTFRGDNAEQQARELVYELRKAHKLAAYTHRQTYDYSGTVSGRGLNPDGSPKTMKYVQGRKIDEVAVLVGDFQSVDDSKAQKILKQLKYIRPEALALEKGKGSSQSFGAFRQIQQRILPDNDEDKKKGPMRHAFIATNPLLPREYFAPQGVDRLVLDMNNGVTNSLLKCPGKYSVKIATFTGYVVLDQKKIEDLERGEHSTESRLAVAAEQAHKVTEALRAKGVEAYEFHDRYESIVTVGSFQDVGSPRQDGKTEINPQVYAIMKQYGGRQDNQAAKIGGTPTAGLKAQRVAGVMLDVQPIPVLVPKRSIASDYRQVNYQE